MLPRGEKKVIVNQGSDASVSFRLRLESPWVENTIFPLGIRAPVSRLSHPCLDVQGDASAHLLTERPVSAFSSYKESLIMTSKVKRSPGWCGSVD